jgi:SAM-dependent methyltransferase
MARGLAKRGGRRRAAAAATTTYAGAAGLAALVALLLAGIWVFCGGMRELTRAHADAARDRFFAADASYEGFANPPASSFASASSAAPADVTRYRHTTVETIFSRNYVRVYDALFGQYRRAVVRTESALFLKMTGLGAGGGRGGADANRRVADLGAGTGRHLVHVARADPRLQVWAVDLAKSCIERCKRTFEEEGVHNYRLVHGDFHDEHLLAADHFDAITLFYFSVYYASSYDRLFANVRRWLKPGGHLCAHVVDVHRFDPVVDAANPLVGINMQRYIDRRLTRSRVFLNRGVVYESQFRTRTDKRRMGFADRVRYTSTNTLVENEHPVNIVEHGGLVRLAKRAGLRLVKQVPIRVVGYEYQYLAFFERPREGGGGGARR